MALKVRPAGLKCVHLRKISLLYYFEIHFISDLNAFLFLLQLKWVYLKANLLEVGLDPIQLRKYSSKNAHTKLWYCKLWQKTYWNEHRSLTDTWLITLWLNWPIRSTTRVKLYKPQYSNTNSPDWSLYQSFSHQVIISWILTTFSLDYVSILLGENWLWSLLGLKRLIPSTDLIHHTLIWYVEDDFRTGTGR